LLIGKSEENGESSSGVSLLIVREVLARAIRFMPQLRDVRVIRIYTGLRPQSGDGLPLIGASARIAGFYYACGHGGDGVTSAPITGRLLSQLIVDGKTEQILRELSPARFA
jgi:sarcosine oxidase subunit beta